MQWRRERQIISAATLSTQVLLLNYLRNGGRGYSTHTPAASIPPRRTSDSVKWQLIGQSAFIGRFGFCIG